MPNDVKFKVYGLDIADYTIYIWCDENDNIARKSLNEAKDKGNIHLIGTYSINKHKSHIPNGKPHIHVYNRQNKIFALNSDGTGHDSSHGIQLPRNAADAIRAKLPNYIVPDIIESISLNKMVEDSESIRILKIMLESL